MFFYLASPYSKYPDGMEKAYEEAVKNAAFLLRNNIPVFSPIAHSHPISTIGGIEAVNHDFWLNYDYEMMEESEGMIQLRLKGWEHSYGMNWEAEQFNKMGLAVIPMTPYKIPVELYHLTIVKDKEIS